MAASDLRQRIAEQACALAQLRGLRCYAVIAETQRLDSSPGRLMASLPRPRHLLWRGSSWLVTNGSAARLRVSGPGRATRLAAAFAKLGERCVCGGDQAIPLPLATLAFSFEERAPGPGAWGQDLPGAEAILPQRAWWKDGRQGWFIRAAAVDPGDLPASIYQRWDQSVIADEGDSCAHPWRTVDHGNFQDLVEDAVALVHHGALRKVVLARAVDITLRQAPSPEQLLERLKQQADPDTTVYWYDLPGQSHFVGATPETLFRLDGQHMATMALAGSRPRGSTPREDRALAKDLLTSTKERKEHNLVLEHITRVLDGRVDHLTVPSAPVLRRLGTVQHLQTSLAASLVASDPFDLLAQLHPTPAVCGLPTALAADHIRRHEGLQRGLYSGVLGWLSPERCHLVVPLRGGIIAGQRARLFAGAGIVETSDPAAEERETDAKLALMRRVLVD